jgi:acyl-CoA dehydrogenase
LCFLHASHVVFTHRADIDQGRMIVQRTASLLDTAGGKGARKEIHLMKAIIPVMVQTVVDRAMQAHGAMGLSQGIQSSPVLSGVV